jgi:hypothetical protein
MLYIIYNIIITIIIIIVVPMLLTEHHAMKAYCGSGVIAPRIL